MQTTAFIGDLHGQYQELRDVVERLPEHVSRLVFLGDYVNRGESSKTVVDYLINLKASARYEIIFLEGNHDKIFRQILNSDEYLNEFFLMGGASTVRSYLDPPYENVIQRFRVKVPRSHRDFFNSLQILWKGDGVTAVHQWSSEISIGSDFLVSGHSVTPTGEPLVSNVAAQIDTGLGVVENRNLTCFLWPSKEWYQSDLKRLHHDLFVQPK
jgi:serine/threonine protein phosphatase 1